MRPERKIIVVGLDAADSRLIARWAAEGKLPAFSELLSHGLYGDLESSAEFSSGSAWPSITSGCNPGKCGIFSRYQLSSGSYDVRRIHAADNRVLPFWSSFTGPLVVVDAPKVALSAGIDGAQVVEWGAYDHYSQFSASPDQLTADILKDFGSHPFIEREFEVALNRRRDFAALKTLLIEGVRQKLKLNLHLLKICQPRFFFSVFGECHAAGHAFWRFHDPCHPGHERNSALTTALLEVYQALDNAVAEMLSNLPPQATFVVLSSHGFTLDSGADEHFLCEFLIKTGMSVPRSTNTRYGSYMPAMIFDMARSKAFPLPSDLQGFFRINLRGREPHGIVHPNDYASVCQELETELLALRHRDSGAPVVKNVVHVHDTLAGPLTADFPDLSAVWNTDAIIATVESPTCGLIRRVPDLSAGGGNHRGSGFILIQGSDFSPGRFKGHVYDVAPTLSHWLGEASRPEWDGRLFQYNNETALR
jgi:predicted AlkP superfamily phosphohydrolase/phosphomutase